MNTKLTKLAICGTGLCDVLDELPLAYVELDTQGCILAANRAARAFHPGRSLIGQDGWDFLAPAQKEQARAEFLACAESGEEPAVIRRSIYVASGSFRTFELHRSLIRNPEGQAIGMRVAGVDVTEVHAAQEEAHRASMWMESVIESVAEAVIVTDALGFVRSINRTAAELTGWTAREIIGTIIDRSLPILSYSSPCGDTLDFRTALSRPCRGEAAILDRQRRELRVEISASPIVDKDNGCTLGVVGILRKVG